MPSPTNKAQDNSIRENVYRVIRENITSLQLAPGTTVSTQELAAKLQVSRTPVREAFQTLEAEGLIELRMNRGAIVKTIDEKYITDHYEMRILLESEAAKRAAQRGMPDAADYIKKLEALPSHMDSVSTEEYEELNLAVHSAIWTAADNERLYKFLSSLWNGPSVGIASPKLDHYIKSTQEHIDILKAIQKQDAKAAQKEMAKHIERSLNNILKNFKFRT